MTRRPGVCLSRVSGTNDAERVAGIARILAPARGPESWRRRSRLAAPATCVRPPPGRGGFVPWARRARPSRTAPGEQRRPPLGAVGGRGVGQRGRALLRPRHGPGRPSPRGTGSRLPPRPGPTSARSPCPPRAPPAPPASGRPPHLIPKVPVSARASLMRRHCAVCPSRGAVVA